jgi:hypothetical protein
MKRSTPIQKPITFNALLTAISDRTRWKILSELMKEALPSAVVAQKVGIPQTNATKHLNQLCRAGIVIRGYGYVYRIPAELIVSGQQAIDAGAVVLRLDRQPR